MGKKMKEVGRNVAYAVDGDTLTIVIDLGADTEPSASGKTMIVASTQGNKKVTDDMFIGINAYRYADKKRKK